MYYCEGTSGWVDSGFWFVDEAGCCCPWEALFDWSAGGDSTVGSVADDSPAGSAADDSTAGSAADDSTAGSGSGTGGCQSSPRETRIFASRSAISRYTSLLSTLTS